jgi:hypothetical protein
MGTMSQFQIGDLVATPNSTYVVLAEHSRDDIWFDTENDWHNTNLCCLAGGATHPHQPKFRIGDLVTNPGSSIAAWRTPWKVKGITWDFTHCKWLASRDDGYFQEMGWLEKFSLSPSSIEPATIAKIELIKTFPKAEPVLDLCKRKYYGLRDCTCSKCA